MAVFARVKKGIFFSKDILNKVLDVEKKSFPGSWLYAQRRVYYHIALKRPENINVFLYAGRSIVGYALMVPYELVWMELSKDDKKMKLDFNRYYLDTIQIIPHYRGLGGSSEMILALCREANRKGISKFSAHLRTKNNLSQQVKKLFFSNITSIRNIKSWRYGGGESYDYIEWKYSSRKKI